VHMEVVDDGAGGVHDADGERTWRSELAAAAGGWCRNERDERGARTVCWLPRW